MYESETICRSASAVERHIHLRLSAEIIESDLFSHRDVPERKENKLGRIDVTVRRAAVV